MHLIARMLSGLIIVLLSSAVVPGEEVGEGWSDRIDIKGDFRLRHEVIDEDGEERHERGRYRARLAMFAQVHPNLEIVLRIASAADNPVSRNVTFDGGFQIENIGFDLAYVDWVAASRLHVIGGKMENPFYKVGGSALIWDGDLNPEGLAAKYHAGKIFATVAGFLIEERSSADDSMLYAAQVGAEFNVSDASKLTAGIGYFAFTNMVGNKPFFDAGPRGNSVDLEGNYVVGYEDVEFFAQLDTNVGDWPLSVFLHLLRNNAASEQDTAYAVGARFGASKAKGDKEFIWIYRDIEADAVVGTIIDSDFGGGGTDLSGHVFKGKIAVTDTITLSGTFYRNSVDRFQGIEHDYNRVQIDVEFKFD
ncbi:MAG: putative porin [Proteobacteria bacterium]|nr:putative porin [Pseudomonadota bacterium]